MLDEHPVMDGTQELPVAPVLRASFAAVVEALRAGDYALGAILPMVDPPSDVVAGQIRNYIREYGETIVSLPEQAWSTSVSMWTGTGWDVLVDLWTAESGRSDMVLAARVTPEGSGYRIRIRSVHVP